MAKTTKHKKKSSTHESPLTAQPHLMADNDAAAISAVNNQAFKKNKSSGGNKPSSKRSQKRARKEKQEDLEEERLTKLLFGDDGESGPLEHFDRDDDSDGDEQPYHTNQKLANDYAEETFAFEIDRTGHNESGVEDEEEGGITRISKTYNDGEASQSDDDSDDDEVEKKDDAPAWEDPDDAATTLVNSSNRLKKLRRSRQETQALSSQELEQRLRERYEDTAQGAARTDWARTSQMPPEKRRQSLGSDDEDDEEFDAELGDAAVNMFSTSRSLLASSRNRLPPNILDIVRCPDANQVDPNKAVVRAVNFHPGSDPDRPLMLTGGLDKSLRFFQIGEEKSEKIHGIHFPKMPIYSASFLGNTGKVVVSGRRSFFYFYDAVAGKVDHVPRILGRDERSWEKHAVSPDGALVAFVGNDGYVVLVDTHSKQWVGNLKLNGSVRAITFTPDGSCILASGSDGDIYRWDVKSRRCLERFPNGDGTITSSLSASSNSLAVGAESGVVNLYSEHVTQPMDSLLGGGRTKTPLKSIMNLHTSADFVRFNPDGQILAMSTQREKHGLKLLHVPSKTVFSNWPTAKTPLGYVWSMDFSPQSKFLAIGNDKGKCLLYKIKQYCET